jgi:hypothetical protein
MSANKSESRPAVAFAEAQKLSLLRGLQSVCARRARRQAHSRRPVEARAMSIERRAVHRHVAHAARPGRVPAAVTEASLVPDEHLSGAEVVPIRASRGRVDHPPPRRRLH